MNGTTPQAPGIPCPSALEELRFPHSNANNFTAMSTTDCINSRNFIGRCGKRLRPLGKNCAVLLAGLALFGVSATHAATINGTGWKGTTDTTWSNASNWDSTGPAADERNLFFGNGYVSAGGTGSTTANNDLTDFPGYRITFEDTAETIDPAFTLTGNALTLYDFGGSAPRIENDSTSLQAFNLNGTLTLSGGVAGFAEANPVNADLVFSATTPIALTAATQLRTYGNAGKTVTFNGIISGAGSSVAINTVSNVVYGAAHTYTGATYVNAAKLSFAAGGSADGSTINILDTGGSQNATMELAPLTGGLALSSPIITRTGSTGTAAIAALNTSGANTLSGAVTLNSSLTISTATGGTLAVTGALSSTGGGLLKTGGGTLNLDHAQQSYDALTVSAGTANVNGTLGTSPGLAVVTVAPDANLKFGTVSQTLSSLTIGAGATVVFTSGVASFGGGGKASGMAGGSVVPEPGTLALVLFGGLTVLNRRRHATV